MLHKNGKFLEKSSTLCFEPRSRTESLEVRADLPDSVEPLRLSQACFKHLGPEDRAVCTYCGGKLHRWRKQDNPLYEHIKNFPFCGFVQNLHRQIGITSRCFRIKRGDTTAHFKSTLGESGFRLSSQTSDFAAGFSPSCKTVLDPQVVARFQPVQRLRSMAPEEETNELEVDHARSTSSGSTLDKGADSDTDNGEDVGLDEPAVEQKVQRRDVKARMDLPITRYLIDNLGFQPSFLRAVIQERLQTRGDDFSSAEEMALAVMIYERKNTKNPAREQERRSLRYQEGMKNWESTRPEAAEGASDNRTKLEKARQRTQCRNCKRRKPDAVLIPCQHMTVCSNCAPETLTCPTCGRPVTRFVKAFLS